MITTFVAFFAFGYCVSDLITNIIQERRQNKLMNEIFAELDTEHKEQTK
jgi:hypothetical protein